MTARVALMPRHWAFDLATKHFASLTALFDVVGSTKADEIRESVLCFIIEKVFPLKAELLKPQEKMERHITDLVKKNLQGVTQVEFRTLLDFLRSLSLFGAEAPPERTQELVGIIEGHVDLDAQFIVIRIPMTEVDTMMGQFPFHPTGKISSILNECICQPFLIWVSDGGHIDRLISCVQTALPLFSKGASSSKFLIYFNKHILPVFGKIPEERKVEVLKNLAECSLYAISQDSRQLLPSVVQLKGTSYIKHMTRTNIEEMNFTYVECLLYTFHQLAHKVCRLLMPTNSLCCHRIVTGQQSDRLGENFSDNYEDFMERLSIVEDLATVMVKRSTLAMAEHNKAMATATDDEKINIRMNKQNVTTLLHTCHNILAMTKKAFDSLYDGGRTGGRGLGWRANGRRRSYH
ncbi:hypothetical protein RJ639_039845 [Escallonia herrerae]|uniref:Uncharacterized protein n=1 Tax=Escallonia herrerae TaxID=1293975 RepID=A0AA88WN27_9ASTE|nr:hypothetical protein RJ639_039845 [Escallonia herrerae]